MDTIPSHIETSFNTLGTSIIGGHFPLGKLGLGKLTPSKSNVVVVLNAFVFNKTKGKVVKKSHKSIKLSKILGLMVITETLLMVYTRTNHISTTSIGFSFS